jgi:hypothetical protein
VRGGPHTPSPARALRIPDTEIFVEAIDPQQYAEGFDTADLKEVKLLLDELK